MLAVLPRPPVLLAAACLALYVASAAQVRTPRGTALGLAAATLSRPLLDGAMALGTLAHDVSLGRQDLRATLAELARLREENERLRRDNQLLAADLVLLRQGSRLLATLPPTGDGALLARVMARDVLVGHSLLLDRGSAHGVTVDAPVLGEAGVVGRVDQVSASAARVQLLTHPSAAAAARIVGVDGEALLTGGDRPTLTGLPPYTQVAAGLPVVTTGSEGIYPPDLLLGTTGEGRTEGYFTLVPVTLAARPTDVTTALVLASRRRALP